MSLTINTNPAAIRASFNLTENNKQLQQSLTRYRVANALPNQQMMPVDLQYQ